MTSYVEGRGADKLDCLVFHVDTLYRLLLALNISNDTLEAIGAGLSLLEELNRSQNDEAYFGYTPETLA